MPEKSLRVERRKPIQLEAGTCITAPSSLRLFLPPGLLEQGGEFKDVVELSDDAVEVGFRESDRQPGKVSAIIVFMRPGDWARIGVATEALVDADFEEVEVLLNTP